MTRILQIGVAASVLLNAGQPEIRREGPFWVERIQGSGDPASARLQITAQGGVKLRQGSGANVEYACERRTGASSEADARRKFASAPVRLFEAGGVARLDAPANPGMCELLVTLPKLIGEVIVTTPMGEIAAEDLNTSLRLATGGGEIKLKRIAGSLHAQSTGGEIRFASAGGPVQIYSGGGDIRADLLGADAVLETGGGTIEIGEARAGVRASTAGGGVRIGKVSGPVTAITNGGPIAIAQAAGLVTARNQGGPIEVGAAAGVRCETASGAIRLTNVTGSLRASTGAGSILARLVDGQRAEESFLTTGDGDITVLIPSNVGVTVQAQLAAPGGVRRIITDFAGITVRSRGGVLVAEGAINGGGPLLRLSGTGGAITIRKVDSK